jgi:predicted nucleic acid-binding protein
MTAYLDTSALAKWYLNEPRSEEFVAYLQSVEEAIVGSLAITEMRSLLARKRRSGAIDSPLEARIFAQLQDDVAQGHLILRPLEDRHVQAAARMIDRLPEHALRTLDAMHLAIATELRVRELATADRVMAGAAAELGLHVVRFD